MSDHPDHSDQQAAPDDEELYEALLAASATVVELESAERRVFVSGVLATWRLGGATPVESQTAIDEFTQWCVARGHDPVAAAIGAAAAPLAAGAMGDESEHTAVTSAWFVHEPGESTGTILVEFQVGEAEPFSLLAAFDEVDGNELLCGLDFGPSAVALLPTEDSQEGLLGVVAHALDADTAPARVAAAWEQTVGTDIDAAVGDATIMNELAARAVLGSVLDTQLGPLPMTPPVVVSFTDGMTEADVTEADAWARDVLRAALGVAPDVDDDRVAAASQPLRGPIDHLEVEDQLALCWLEWADWLGVVIGLVRAGDGSEVSGERCVDLINRCGEVTTTVPKEDREYAAHAFTVAISLWTDNGLVENGRLVSGAGTALHAGAATAWSNR